MQFLRRTNIFSRAKMKYDNQINCKIIFKCLSSNLKLLVPDINEEINNYEINHQDDPNKTSPTFTDYKKFIIENLGVDENEANILIHRSNKFLQIPLKTIDHCCHICRMRNIDMKNGLTDIKFLELNEQQLEERIALLKEMGAMYITTTMITRCGGTSNVAFFKAFAEIPNSKNICQELYSILHEPPCDVPKLGPISETLSMNEYRKTILSHYLKWRLEFPADQDKLLKLVTSKLLYKSFANIKNSFDVLHYDYELPIEIIRTKRCLENTCAIDMKRILTELKTICDLSVKYLLNSWPQLHKMRYENVSIAKKLLEKYNFTKIQLENCPEILLVDVNNLIEGIEAINNIPELKILIDHPLILQIVLTKDGISNRIHYLKYLGYASNFTIKILGSPLSKFDTYLRDTRSRHKDKEFFLELAKQLGIDIVKLKSELKKHSLWKRANVMSIYSTRRYLIDNFDIQDIYKNLQLLLYTREKVESVCIDLIKMNESLSQEERYTSCQLLALCIYKIEKAYHFTGEGIWELTPEIQTTPRNPQHEEEEEEEEHGKYLEYPSVADAADDDGDD